MKQRIIDFSIFIAILIFIVSSAYLIGRYNHNKSTLPAIVRHVDTLQFKVRELEHTIETLKAQREALQADTATFYNRYNQLLSRINDKRNHSDSAQYSITGEILHKDKPELIDINQSIVKGQLCCELYSNQCLQLKNADSIITSQDTVIYTQAIEINFANQTADIYATVLASEANKVNKTKNHLRSWRSAALLQAAIITASITLYKLLH
jgi:chromosome segregation ATPase